ncbi:uncharacterized protein si:ch211-214p13.7 [Girardinichthys multiradiatus]|uniref:Uncharacterized protein n=2 Tax=Goodeidae TaxID=28758 RepID=A0ABU7AVU5_9TELE|nr:uncharacterized protein si:ch211-214p13.7 [Girardinichthys multiradiatus]MED6242093.1 hypothetical protein [Ataeniobius toweri]
MGNCTSGQQKKKKGNAAPTDESNENRPNEDVMYASINHTGLGPRQDKAANKHQPDDDCDYATVKIQEEVPADSHSESSKDECADDYVLMG